jgi:hypothetical protein
MAEDKDIGTLIQARQSFKIGPNSHYLPYLLRTRALTYALMSMRDLLELVMAVTVAQPVPPKSRLGTHSKRLASWTACKRSKDMPGSSSLLLVLSNLAAPDSEHDDSLSTVHARRLMHRHGPCPCIGRFP